MKWHTNSQTWTIFGMDKLFHPTLTWTCDYISMLGLKLTHVSKRAHCGNRGKLIHWSRVTHIYASVNKPSTGLKLENYYFFTFTFSRPEVRKLLLFYVFTFSRPEVRKLLLFYVFTFSRPEVRKLLLFYVFTFSRPEVRKLFRIYVFTFSRPEVRKLLLFYVFTFSRPEVRKLLLFLRFYFFSTWS